jgi:hypothetical protein
MSKKIDTKGTGLQNTITFRDVAFEALDAQTAHEDAKDAKVSVADHFLKAAQTYGMDAEKVLKRIVDEEVYMKSENCPVNRRWDKIPAVWVQCKSNIKKGIEAGIDPTKFETMSKYRKSLNEKRAADKPKTDAETALGEAADISSVNPELGQTLQALMASVAGTTEEQQPDVLKVLQSAIQDIKVLRALVPEKPAKTSKKATSKKSKPAMTAKQASEHAPHALPATA